MYINRKGKGEKSKIKLIKKNKDQWMRKIKEKK